MRKTILLLSVLILTLAACKKASSPYPVSYKNVTATIVRSDPNAIGSCGWGIRLTYASYHPINLDTTRVSPGQQVVIDYTLTGDSFGCGDPGTSWLKVIRIDNLR